MKNKENAKKPRLEVVSFDLVERWTIDRLDREANVARLEKVPLSEKYGHELIEMLGPNMEIPTEKLEWWDSSKTYVSNISITELRDFLMLKNDETLNENMVFWIFKTELKPIIIHATTLARNLAGELYRKVMGTENGGMKND